MTATAAMVRVSPAVIGSCVRESGHRSIWKRKPRMGSVPWLAIFPWAISQWERIRSSHAALFWLRELAIAYRGLKTRLASTHSAPMAAPALRRAVGGNKARSPSFYAPTYR